MIHMLAAERTTSWSQTPVSTSRQLAGIMPEVEKLPSVFGLRTPSVETSLKPRRVLNTPSPEHQMNHEIAGIRSDSDSKAARPSYSWYFWA